MGHFPFQQKADSRNYRITSRRRRKSNTAAIKRKGCRSNTQITTEMERKTEDDIKDSAG